MKINTINTEREYDGVCIDKLKITIDFDTSNPDNKPDGDALYYLICALDKCKGKSHKDLDFMSKMKVVSRLDACLAQIKNIKKEINI